MDNQQQLQQAAAAVRDFENQLLPLARIKKIMKTDENVRMISAEAPVLFAKACEMFMMELTLRSWTHTEDNKRRTLQRNDIAMAITKNDTFDFLIDFVPRDDIKPAKKLRDEMTRPAMLPDQMQYYLLQQAQMAQQQAQQQGQQPGQPGDGQMMGRPLMDPLLLYQQQVQLMQHWQLQNQQNTQQQQHDQQQQAQQGHEGAQQ
eukprot:GFYU01000483.1.p2 GENE.GFYU01000483.1~~GFYU01000483.1.p2  ORF type:complete len:203 (-),score=69.45 GFYU01000483.1:834-1442(-)